MLEAQEEISKLYKQLTSEKKKVSTSKKKRQTLKHTLSEIKSARMVEKSGLKHLETLLTPTLHKLLERISKTSGRILNTEYAPELRVFASTLLFYSPKAYEYVRTVFSKAIPHEVTVRRWFSNIDGSPGFSIPALKLLQSSDTGRKGETAKEKDPVLWASKGDAFSSFRLLHFKCLLNHSTDIFFKLNLLILSNCYFSIPYLQDERSKVSFVRRVAKGCKLASLKKVVVILSSLEFCFPRVRRVKVAPPLCTAIQIL